MDRYTMRMSDFSEKQRDIIYKNCKLSGKIRQLMDIRTYLRKEIFSKKSKYKGKETERKYPVDKKCFYYHKYYLYDHGKDYWSLFDWNASLRYGMEDIFYLELDKLYNGKEKLYNLYNHEAIYSFKDEIKQYVDEYNIIKKYQDFDKNDWKLDDGIEFTSRDEIIIKNYRLKILNFLEKQMPIIKNNLMIYDGYYKELNYYYKRLIKSMNRGDFYINKL